MTSAFVRILAMFLLTSDIIMTTSLPTNQTAAIQATLPGASSTPVTDRYTGTFVNSTKFGPFITNTLLQAIAEESEHKKRVQRYRDNRPNFEGFS